MTVILSQIYCIVNQYLTEYIHTGNRVVDNHLIVLIPLILASFVDIISIIWKQRILQYIWHRYIKQSQYGFDATAVLYRSFKIDANCQYQCHYIMNRDDDHQYWVQKEFGEKVKQYLSTYFSHQNEITLDRGKSVTKDLLNMKKKEDNNFHKNIGNIAIFPIWFSKKHKKYVFIREKLQKDDEPYFYTCKVYLTCNVKDAMIEFYDFIQTFDTNKNEEDSHVLKIVNNNYKPYHKVGLLSPHKNFDQLFFDNKQNVLEVLKKFKEGKLYPSHFGMDNKLGILLHGPPGTGKTSFITCVANYLQRDVFLINLTKVEQQNDLECIFQPENYLKYVFVFEELDCIPEVVKIRDGTVDLDIKSRIKEIEQNYFQMIGNVKDSSQQKEMFSKMKKEINELKNSINLSYLLQKLDGVESANNRIIIATTNHPEFIDPALLRPGRFDIKLNLKNCSITMLSQILSFYFQQHIPMNSFPAGLDNQFAPVDVINLCMTSNKYEQVLEQLSNSKKIK